MKSESERGTWFRLQLWSASQQLATNPPPVCGIGDHAPVLAAALQLGSRRRKEYRQSVSQVDSERTAVLTGQARFARQLSDARSASAHFDERTHFQSFLRKGDTLFQNLWS